MQSNPIQQRIEVMCDKWEDAKKNKNAAIVRIKCQPDEVEMVDAFYTYMIAADTPILDIGFHFEADCKNIKTYSLSLVKELEEIIYIWNNSSKDARIEYVEVNWKADYSYQNHKNPAALFISNFNNLANALNLPEDLYTVAILKGATQNKNLINWLQQAAEFNISNQTKYLIHDTFQQPIFESLTQILRGYITTIPLNLNMPKAIEQAAAMGDPKDPATPYRQAFTKMINAMTAGDESLAEKSGAECIEIATNNLNRDPYWITQIVVIYIALANDKIRYKKKLETLKLADKAVETSISAQQYFENNVASSLLAQSQMFRGTVLFTQHEWFNAYNDFNAAFEVYQKEKNIPLAIEAGRMAGQSALKISLKAKAGKILTEAARLGNFLDENMARASTFPGVLELLLQNNLSDYISYDELNDIGRKVYGENWQTVVANWKKMTGENYLKPKPSVTA